MFYQVYYSDVDQLILALMFRFGFFWPGKLNIKFSRLYQILRHSLNINFFCIFFMNY